MDLFGLVRITWLPGKRTARATTSSPVSESAVITALTRLADDLAELASHDWRGESASLTLRLVRRQVDKVLAEYGNQALADKGGEDQGTGQQFEWAGEGDGPHG